MPTMTEIECPSCDGKDFVVQPFMGAYKATCGFCSVLFDDFPQGVGDCPDAAIVHFVNNLYWMMYNPRGLTIDPELPVTPDDMLAN